MRKARYGKGNNDNWHLHGCIAMFILTSLSPGASNFLPSLPSSWVFSGLCSLCLKKQQENQSEIIWKNSEHSKLGKNTSHFKKISLNIWLLSFLSSCWKNRGTTCVFLDSSKSERKYCSEISFTVMKNSILGICVFHVCFLWAESTTVPPTRGSQQEQSTTCPLQGLQDWTLTYKLHG